MYYLHETAKVVHRDLKPENILLRGNSEVKLTDFGLAKQDSDGRLQTFCGTPQYFAPEVLNRAHTIHGRGRYGKPADLWSLGVVLYVMLTGCTPQFDATSKIEWDPADASLSQGARDLILQLLDPNPATRATVMQCCEHPWILTFDPSDTHQNPLHDPLLKDKERRKESKQNAVPDAVHTSPQETCNGGESTVESASSKGEIMQNSPRKRPPLSPLNSPQKKIMTNKDKASPIRSNFVQNMVTTISPLANFDTPTANPPAAPRRVSGSTSKPHYHATDEEENRVF